MSVKASLKAAKAAIDAQDWAKAAAESQNVLASDSQNYFALLFLGRAQEKQGKWDDAAQTYTVAANSKPADSQAWLGLCSVYEAQGATKLSQYQQVAVKAAEVFAAADDVARCQNTIDKFVDFARKHGNSTQLRQALRVLLPGTPIYDCLEGRILPPAQTYSRLAELTEKDEEQRITQEVSNRRTRIGARLNQVTTEVKREVFGSSDLEQIYQQIINWSSDDEVRRNCEEKLLQRAYDTLTVLPIEQKGQKLDQVLTLAEGMVIVKHPFQLAWDLVLETRDLDDLRDLDVGILREYTTNFPSSGLAKVLVAWLGSELSPFPPPKPEELGEDKDIPRELSPEDRLLFMSEGLAASQDSALSHRLVSDYYLHLEEHESAVETARAGLKVLILESSRLGMGLQNTRDALCSVLGTGLVQYQAPRHHAEARNMFEDILQRKPKSTPALIGLGLIFEETESYPDAITFFERALQEDQSNIRVGTELAWCRALCGDYARAQSELEAYLPGLKADDPRARDLRAQVLYRIGMCVWNMDTSKAARKDRNGAYSQFLAAIKINVNFAPAYTSLGLYYADYGKDRKRARQCFQKAFELSAGETDAAERLAKYFADQADWDIVEVVAQRVVDSGRARPPPGSKKKGLSWPYSALGVVQMNKQQYQQAIVSFLAALRINPHDYQSYVGLGESYHNSGRYNSALRTFTYALDPPEGVELDVKEETWFARYMLANVHRELGDYDEAIIGLQGVLANRPTEFGVLMSLLQTFVEKAWRCHETGTYGQAIDSATQAMVTARLIANDRPSAFNMWKGLGDACMIYSYIQSGIDGFPREEIVSLLHVDADEEKYNHLSDIDRITLSSLKTEPAGDALAFPLVAGVLAMKRAISAATTDVHAQAVAWYNLGWAEYRVFISGRITTGGGRRYLKAAVRCFKRAIELEASNAEFWNAMGVVTTTLNPQVAQHSFVRSLHINELNAKVWANLGVLYLRENDFELAHQAFGRSQSTDPDYAHAWVGEGLLALLSGSARQALDHFTHAFEIADSSLVLTKRQYALCSFDELLVTSSASNDLTSLISPVFALEQLRAQAPRDLPYRHLAALFLERVGDHGAAVEILTELCRSAEAEYEANEADAALARYAHAQSDLARNQLAAHDFASAVTNAGTALDLSSDTDSCGLDAESRRRLRLSSHLTAGLAAHHLDDSTTAIPMFRAALVESDSNPDVVCALVQVLWAHGGAEERSVSREQLFAAAEQHPTHVATTTLLGAIVTLDDDVADVETRDAVTSDLLSLRTSAGLTPADVDAIETLLAAFASQSPAPDARRTAAQRAILLRPERPQGWMQLAVDEDEHRPNSTEASFTARMALLTAQSYVPPRGTLAAVDLARACAGVGTPADAQRAIMLAPADPAGWQSLAEAVSV